MAARVMTVVLTNFHFFSGPSAPKNLPFVYSKTRTALIISPITVVNWDSYSTRKLEPCPPTPISQSNDLNPAHKHKLYAGNRGDQWNRPRHYPRRSILVWGC